MPRTKEAQEVVGEILCKQIHGLAKALGVSTPRLSSKEARRRHLESVTVCSPIEDQIAAERYFKSLQRKFYRDMKAKGHHIPNDPPKKRRRRKTSFIKDLPKALRP